MIIIFFRNGDIVVALGNGSIVNCIEEKYFTSVAECFSSYELGDYIWYMECKELEEIEDK